eukprot:jgi/Tetstr1/440578/TSEL_028899.t1
MATSRSTSGVSSAEDPGVQLRIPIVGTERPPAVWWHAWRQWRQICRPFAARLHFIDVAPVGSILAPGRVWAMLEGEGDTRKDFAAPCCGEIAEVNEEAIQAGDASSWLIRVYCDRVLPDMQPE